MININLKKPHMIWVVLLLNVVLNCCYAKPNGAKSPVKPSPEFDQVRQEIMQLVKEGHTPSFSIAVLQKGKIIWQESFKQSSDTSGVSITSDAQYPLASLSKSISATLVLKLVENGQLSLDDEIKQHLPNQLKYLARNDSTIQELLNMTAGIPHGGLSFKSDSTYAQSNNSDLIKYYGMTVFPKGIYEYSNFSYGVVEAIIETVTGKPYAQALKENLFDPLGMHNSFIEQKLSGSLKNTTASKDNTFSATFFPAAGAGIYSTLGDVIAYAKFNLNEMDKPILSPASFKKLHHTVIPPSTIFSLGWANFAITEDITWVLSNGSFRLSANSNLTLIPEHNIAVICLANRDYQSMADVMAIKTVDVMLPGFAEKTFVKIENYDAADANPINMDGSNFNQWEGTMKSSDDEYQMKFVYQDDEFYVSINKAELQPVESATMDRQSVIRGRVTIPIKNPITHQIKETTGSINLLVSKTKLQGYFSGFFEHPEVVFMNLPFYVEAHGKSE